MVDFKASDVFTVPQGTIVQMGRPAKSKGYKGYTETLAFFDKNQNGKLDTADIKSTELIKAKCPKGTNTKKHLVDRNIRYCNSNVTEEDVKKYGLVVDPLFKKGSTERPQMQNVVGSQIVGTCYYEDSLGSGGISAVFSAPIGIKTLISPKAPTGIVKYAFNDINAMRKASIKSGKRSHVDPKKCAYVSSEFRNMLGKEMVLIGLQSYGRWTSGTSYAYAEAHILHSFGLYNKAHMDVSYRHKGIGVHHIDLNDKPVNKASH